MAKTPNILIFFFLMQNFIELYETINALLTVLSEMHYDFQEIIKHKDVRNPSRTLCHRLMYIMNNLPLGDIALRYVIQNNCRKV